MICIIFDLLKQFFHESNVVDYLELIFDHHSYLQIEIMQKLEVYKIFNKLPKKKFLLFPLKQTNFVDFFTQEELVL